jgi:hypothetical protein
MRDIIELEKELATATDARATIERKLSRAKKAIAESNYPENLIALAESVHKHTCRSEHIESCDWYYGDWDAETLVWYKQRAIEQAEALINGHIDVAVFDNIFDRIKNPKEYL